MTNALDGNLTLESTPSNHEVSVNINENDGEDIFNGRDRGTTPLDITGVDELRPISGSNPDGFDFYSVGVESEEDSVDLESVTLLNDGNEVATSGAPLPEDSDDINAGAYVIKVNSP